MNISNVVNRQRKQAFYFMALILVLTASLIFSSSCYAEAGTIPLLVANQIGSSTSYSLSIKILAVMTALTVLPAMLITTSAFARIIIVLAILRQAIGIPNVPSNQILIGLSLIMTLYVMSPMLQKANEVSVQPYMSGKMTEEQALANSGNILKTFMLKQIRKTDLKAFADLAKVKAATNEDYPIMVLLPSFITSELKTAFQIGFLIFMPFLIIDLVVASILMSMGMMMLSPMVISLPFKILFFVMVDGWSLIVTSLITSFRI